MRDENCIFCKIANGEIPSATIYEDDDFRVILDLGPATKGHALILPKEHAADIYSIDEELAGKAFKLAKKITTRLKDVLGCDGQTVFHFHMHLIPRYKNDKSGFGWKPGKLTDEDRDEILEKLKEK